MSRRRGALTTAEQMLLAAVWSYGPEAVASHRSARWLWLGETPTDLHDVLVPTGQRPRARPGVVVHTSSDEFDRRPSVRNGIPSTNPLRTLIDLGSVAPDLVAPTLTRFVVDGLLTVRATRAALERHRPGSRGTSIARAGAGRVAVGRSTSR